MLRGIELEVLAAIEHGDAISELATKRDHSESYLSRAVAALAEYSLVYRQRDGRRNQVVPSGAQAVELYQDLVRQHSHIEFPELLTGKALEVLYYLDQPRIIAEIAEQSDTYRNTVTRVLKRMRDRGLVGIDDGRYHLNGDFKRLHEFACELAHHFHRQRRESVAPNGTTLWEDDDELLAHTETEINAEHFQEPGLARFAAFDLQFLLTRHRYYFEELEAVSAADLCCHTLLIDDDIRHRSYCLLLLSHVDIVESELRNRTEAYGLATEIGELLQYLGTGSNVESKYMPTGTEFQVRAVVYEIEY